ncbi:MAG: hypothetical protein J3Q66DRAFT_439299 [Benniella sp.]|nr:MAG: hypothetical protein J3Q66DRAFT_439299 [Benniella sp.]
MMAHAEPILGYWIDNAELAVFAHESSNQESFVTNLALIHQEYTGAQTGNGCTVDFVILRQLVPASSRRVYAQTGGFEANVFESIVASNIGDPQRLANCRERLQQGTFLTIRSVPQEELFIGLPSLTPGGPPPNPVDIQAQVPVEGSEGGLQLVVPSTTRHMKSDGEGQFQTPVIAFVYIQEGAEGYWGGIVEAIMDSPIFQNFVDDEVRRREG